MGTTIDNSSNKTPVVGTDKTPIADGTGLPKHYTIDQIATYTLASLNGVIYKGVIDCSANPNYPAADAGHMYVVSVAGKIGGASGTTVEAGDAILCKTDSTASGTQAGVGANWDVLQANLVIDTDGTLAANSDALVASQKATKTYADAKIAQTITNGVTTSAPSQDAVFDALNTGAKIKTFGCFIDGGVVTPTSPASKVIIPVPYTGTITAWYVAADASGSCQFDIKRSNVSIIGAGNKPLLSSAASNTAAPSGWTSVAVTAGDLIEFYLDSSTTVLRIALVLTLALA